MMFFIVKTGFDLHNPVRVCISTRYHVNVIYCNNLQSQFLKDFQNEMQYFSHEKTITVRSQCSALSVCCHDIFL